MSKIAEVCSLAERISELEAQIIVRVRAQADIQRDIDTQQMFLNEYRKKYSEARKSLDHDLAQP